VVPSSAPGRRRERYARRRQHRVRRPSAYRHSHAQASQGWASLSATGVAPQIEGLLIRLGTSSKCVLDAAMALISPSLVHGPGTAEFVRIRSMPRASRCAMMNRFGSKGGVRKLLQGTHPRHRPYRWRRGSRVCALTDQLTELGRSQRPTRPLFVLPFGPGKRPRSRTWHVLPRFLVAWLAFATPASGWQLHAGGKFTASFPLLSTGGRCA
jgi:hypothetical protein